MTAATLKRLEKRAEAAPCGTCGHAKGETGHRPTVVIESLVGTDQARVKAVEAALEELTAAQLLDALRDTLEERRLGKPVFRCPDCGFRQSFANIVAIRVDDTTDMGAVLADVRSFKKAIIHTGKAVIMNPAYHAAVHGDIVEGAPVDSCRSYADAIGFVRMMLTMTDVPLRPPSEGELDAFLEVVRKIDRNPGDVDHHRQQLFQQLARVDQERIVSRIGELYAVMILHCANRGDANVFHANT